MHTAKVRRVLPLTYFNSECYAPMTVPCSLGNLNEEEYSFVFEKIKMALADHLDASGQGSSYLLVRGESETVVQGSETGNIVLGLDHRLFLQR